VRVILVAIISLFTVHWVYGQEVFFIDTADLEFSSSYEEEVFYSSIYKEATFFKLLFCIGNPKPSEATYESYLSRLKTFESQYQKLSFEENKVAKSLKRLKKGVDDEWLKLYRLNALPYYLSNEGIFNCVTGTMLYAQILQDFGQSIVINVYPEHVNLDIKYTTNKVSIEPTASNLGYVLVDRSYKVRHLKGLLEMKVISEEEFTSKGIDELFDRYYFQEITTDIRGLTALQYYNNGLYEEELGHLSNGIEELLKSYYLERFEPTERVLYELLLDYLLEVKEYTQRDLDYLRYAILLSNSSDRNHLAGVELYNRFSSQILMEKQDTALYNLATNKLVEALSDGELKNEILFTNSLLMYQFSVTNLGYEASEDYLLQAYKAKPSYLEIQASIIQHIIKRITSYSSPGDWYAYIDDIAVQYDFLDSNQVYRAFVAEINLASSQYYFQVGNKKNALAELAKFESKSSHISTEMLNKDLVADVYSRAASYYYLQGNDRKALAVINQGLLFAPQNGVLIMKKNVLTQ